MTHRSFKLTLLVRADHTGLGYQTRDYYKFLKPDRTIIIDISGLNGNQQHYEWYENAEVIQGIPNDLEVDNILSDTDVLLTAETPYNLNLYRRARQLGVKTICVENPEFYDHVIYPKYAMPNLIILPSVWKMDFIQQHAESRGTKVVQLHHPVDRSVFTFKKRLSNKTMHISGKPAMHDRNGTMNYLHAQPDGIVTTQDRNWAHRLKSIFPRARVIENIQDPLQIYHYGDVLIFPRKYGGNCLPLNEALSTGMPVIMPDIEPNNHLLPKEWLVPAEVTDHFEPRTKVEVYTVNHDALVEKINWLHDTDISIESEKANQIADTISWETLLPKWEEAIESVL